MRQVLNKELDKILTEQAPVQKREVTVSDREALLDHLLKTVFDRMELPDPRVLIADLNTAVRSQLGRALLKAPVDGSLCIRALRPSIAHVGH